MFTKILTSALLFLIAIGGFFVSIENGIQIELNETYAAKADCPDKWSDEF
jgi:hypothetical protein